ncbi:hypothetical protein [Roseateles saccharophilus]|uniref:Tetratricopeptide repeat protein n=1 Tax=Roseateles saccharophilus TaxID=304 RepID=A0A4R3UCN9_ROSSA|nr:hypothetical protein [Roseateles saccharophilus]MDG0835622.1 hypothetical protein [Roseateles saccharophilus]TCU85129.1 hypothetical protein EV671_105019 [Roseateles saccharophilus]
MSVRLRSRLAQRLDGEIAAVAAMPPRAAVLQAQRAILWLRHGRDAEAREELDRLHARALVHPRVELAAWLHLAQGLMAYFGAFSGFGGGARERVRRARVMAAAAGLTPLRALADAWLAQMDFVGRDIDGLITHAQAALAALQPDDHGAAYRVATALASAWSLAGGEAAASPWYAWARQHAIAEGDDAGMAALLYNQTQMRALRIRHAALAGEPGEAPAVLLGVESVGHFDDAVGGSARGDLTPLLRAQLMTAQGDYAEAAALLQAQLPAAMAAGLARLGGSLLADLAWCWANTGEPARARALADQAALEVLAEDQPSCDIDERAALHARLAQVYARLHEDGLAAAQADAAAAAWAEDAAQRRDWCERLNRAGLGSPPR